MKDNIDFYVEFITEVERNPTLYNRGLTDYNDRRITEIIWTKIGEKFKEKGEDCKTKWKSIRSAYIRSLNTQSKKEYYLAPYLQFLNPFIKTKVHEVNIPIIRDEEDSEHKYHIEETSNYAPDLTSADEDSVFVPSPPASNLCTVDYLTPNKKRRGYTPKYVI